MLAEPAAGPPCGATTDRVGVACARPAGPDGGNVTACVTGPDRIAAGPSGRTTGCTSIWHVPTGSGRARPSWTARAGSSSAQRPRPVTYPGARPAGGLLPRVGRQRLARRALRGADRPVDWSGGSRSSTPDPSRQRHLCTTASDHLQLFAIGTDESPCGPSAGWTTRAGGGGAGSTPGRSGSTATPAAVWRAAFRFEVFCPGLDGQPSWSTAIPGPVPSRRVGPPGGGSPIRVRTAGNVAVCAAAADDPSPICHRGLRPPDLRQALARRRRAVG